MTKEFSKDFALKFYKDYSKAREVLVNSFKENISFYQKVVLSQQFIFNLFVTIFLVKKKLIRRADNSTFTSKEFFKSLLESEAFIPKILEASSYYRTHFPNRHFSINDHNYIMPLLNSAFFELLSQLDSKSITIANSVIEEILDFVNYYFENPDFSFDVFGVVFEKDLNLLEILRIEQIEFNRDFKLLMRLSERRKKGIYYTPEVITNYICRKALLHSLQEHFDLPNEKFEATIAKMNKISLEKLYTFISQLSILDPTCGAGNFLLEMCDLLFNIRKLILQKLDKKIDSFNLKNEILISNIHGVDIQNIAISITALRLWLWLLDDYNPETNKTCENYLPDLIPNLQVGNSLIGFSFEKIEQQDEDYLIRSDVQKLVIESQKKLLGIQQIEKDNDILQSFNSIVEMLKTISVDQKIFTNQELLESTFGNLQMQIRRRSLDFVTRNELKLLYSKIRELLYEILNNKFKDFTQKKNKNLEISLEDLEQLKPFHWKADYYSIINDGGFDIIIGNPPYLENKKLRNKTEKKLLKELFETAYKLYDLSILFIERSHTILKEKGQFSFIITNKFISTDYGIKIRKLILLKTQLNEIINISDLPIFEDAATYPIIISFCKASSTLDVNNLENEFSVLPFIADIKYLKQHDTERITVSQSYFYSLPKHVFALSGNAPLINAIYNSPRCIKLSDIGNFAYRVLGFTDWGKSLESLKLKRTSKRDLRFIGTTNVSRFVIDWKKTIKLGGKRLTNTYLPYSKDLEDAWEIFLREKILIKEISKMLTASFDPGIFANATGIYMFIPKKEYNPKFLTVLLNSHLLRLVFKILFGSTHMAGGYLRFNGSYLSELPIIIPKQKWQQDIMSNLSDYLSFFYQLLLEDIKNPILGHTEEIANSLVMELYFESEFEKSIFDEIRKIIKPIEFEKWYKLSLNKEMKKDDYNQITQEILQIITATITAIYEKTEYNEIINELHKKESFPSSNI